MTSGEAELHYRDLFMHDATEKESRKRCHSPDLEIPTDIQTKRSPSYPSEYVSNAPDYDRSTDDVWILGRSRGTRGFTESYGYQRKGGVKQLSFQEIKQKVLNGNHEMKESSGILFYAAFNEALLRLLEKVEEVKNDPNNLVRMILIHGVPQIGKSTLATCLAYFLSLAENEGKKIGLHKLQHSNEEDSDVMAQKVYNEWDTKTGKDTHIFDQVNLNDLSFKTMLSCFNLRFRVNQRAMPVIFFTSGHYHPGEQWLNWLNNGWLHYKVIQVKCDEDLVNSLLQGITLPKDVIIPAQEIINTSTVFSHVSECVNVIDTKKVSMSADALRDEIFPEADVRFLGKERLSHIIWIGWQKILSKGLPNLENLTLEHCSMEPRLMQYLAYWISREKKDVFNTELNCLLNQMDLNGDALYSQNNYTEFDHERYRYIFLNPFSLHSLLKKEVSQYEEYNPKERLNILLKVYDILKSEGKKVNSGRGVVLEVLIKHICLAEALHWNHKVGMTVGEDGENATFTRVDDFIEVATVHDLCSVVVSNEMCKRPASTIFCDLNVEGHSPFRGYDYAHIATTCVGENIAVKHLYLFQVTVNVRSKDNDKTRAIMSEVLDDVKQQLVTLKLVRSSDVDEVVVPFFVQPDARSDIKIELPVKNSPEKLVVCALDMTFPSTKY